MESSVVDIPIEEQRRSWGAWNAAAREGRISVTSARQAEVVEQEVARLNRRDLAIIDVGCGTGWMAERLSAYGRVTATDLVVDVLERARRRAPQVEFISGDIFELDLPPGHFDLAVTLEVLSHVRDHRAFIARLAELIKPGGRLILATQNRPVLERWSAVGGPNEGQLRRWVNASELRLLLEPHFGDIDIISLSPLGDQGFLRVINSPKLNALLGSVVAPERIERVKEQAMLGHTLLVQAKRPSAP